MSKTLNAKPLVKGATFEVVTAIAWSDAGNGFSNLVVDSTVDFEGHVFQETKGSWYGLDSTHVKIFNDSLTKNGVVAGTVTVVGFKKLIDEWKKLTAALTDLNKAGEDFAALLGDE